VAIVDAEDGHLLDDGWSVAMRGSDPAALTKRINGSTERLHRWLTTAGMKQIIDHINGNPLDNRRVNLRICTPAENARNRRAQRGSHAGYKGVHWHNVGKWRAVIWANGVRHDLGVFGSREEAASAYDKAALELHGEFARTNLPLADQRPSGFVKPGIASGICNNDAE
jgi:hypothetical protein